MNNKLIYSFFLILGITFISNSVLAKNGRGTKLRPYAGCKYTYSFKVASGLKYEFYLSENILGVGTKLINIDEVLEGDTGVVGTNGSAEVSILWGIDAATNYTKGVYLFIHVYGGSNTNICDNYSAVRIIPIANEFNVLALGDVHKVCASFMGFNPIVAPIDSYNAGKTTLEFNIIRSGSINNWFLSYTITTVNVKDYTYSFDNEMAVSCNKTVSVEKMISSSKDNDKRILTIVADNIPGKELKFQVTINVGTKDALTLGEPKKKLSKKTITINIMPKIGNFN